MTEWDNGGNGDESVGTLLKTLDHVAMGVAKFEARLRLAVANEETGHHTLRVHVCGGVVRRVVHTAEEDV